MRQKMVFFKCLEPLLCITCKNVKWITFKEFEALYALLTNVFQRPPEIFDVRMSKFIPSLHRSFTWDWDFEYETRYPRALEEALELCKCKFPLKRSLPCTLCSPNYSIFDPEASQGRTVLKTNLPSLEIKGWKKWHRECTECIHQYRNHNNGPVGFHTSCQTWKCWRSTSMNFCKH